MPLAHLNSALGFQFFALAQLTVKSLQNILGKWSSTVYAVSLLASGQSSTVTGTYAGQYIMQVRMLRDIAYIP